MKYEPVFALSVAAHANKGARNCSGVYSDSGIIRITVVFVQRNNV